MKLSTTLLLVAVILVLLVTSLFASNISLKKEHDRANTSGFYSTYGGKYIFAKYEF